MEKKIFYLFFLLLLHFLIPYNFAYAEGGVSDNMKIKLIKPEVEKGLSFPQVLYNVQKHHNAQESLS